MDCSGVYNVEETLSPDSCSKTPTALPVPELSATCWDLDSLTISYIITGATTASDTGYVPGDLAFETGISTVNYVITDPDGNTDTCSFTVTIVSITPPVIECSDLPNVVDSIPPDSCSMVPDALTDPDIYYTCWPADSISITYNITNRDGNIVSGTGLIAGRQVFDVGLSYVEYIISDPDGNSDTCSFTVEIKQLNIPDTTYESPDPWHEAYANEDICEVYFTLDALQILSDPCNVYDSIWNNSPYRTDELNASGWYPVDTTEFYWYIRNVSGIIDSSPVTVVVHDTTIELLCPESFTVDADFDSPYASGVDAGIPYFKDNCDSILTWTVSGATTFEELETDTLAPNVYVVHSLDTFNLGVTTIEYTFSDGNGNIEVCSYTITVTGPPEIECPDPDTFYANENCVYPFDPGIPELIEGVPPIDWYWTMTDTLGNVLIDGSGRVMSDSTIGAVDPPLADPIGEFDFPLGVTQITWIAKNVSGADTCWQEITVLDTTPPVFTDTIYENCVDPIHWAVYNPTTSNARYAVGYDMEISPVPDYRTFPSGDTSLDLLTLYDNCCDSADIDIYWEIVFTDVPNPYDDGATYISHDTIRGYGQPSEYVDPDTGLPTDIKLWGDGVNFDPVTHTITYWAEDCNGNMSKRDTRTIVITPRPEITKEDY